MVDTPECDRMVAVAPFSQKIGEFLDWCVDAHGWSLAEYAINDDVEPGFGGLARLMAAHPHAGIDMHPARYSIQSLLAEFFDIDLQKVEDERRTILAAMRAAR